MPHLLAIDQGTTNTKVLLFDEQGAIEASASRPVSVRFPAPGWVEQDAIELWRTVEEASVECLRDHRDRTLAAVAITNQRESVLAWDRASGRPVGPCIVWQCRRTMPFCADLRRRRLQGVIEEKTGLTIDPLFSASKIRWLLDSIDRGHPRAAAGDLCVGTVDSWLLWNLTGGAVHATDASNASRTQLYNLQTGSWDDTLLEIFGVPRAALPEVRPSSGVFGWTSPGGAFPAGVPVSALIGDSHAALFGHAAFRPGAVKATYGTGSSLMSPLATPVRSAHRLSTTVAWAMGDHVRFALEGNITATGSAVEWVSQVFGEGSSPTTVARMAASVPDAGGAYLVPAFAGLGAPHWDDEARGILCGLTRGTSAAHIARATIEAIAYQVRDVFEAMVLDQASRLEELLADGGASRNDALMQCQADLLGRPVVRPRLADLSALGAAWLGGLAVGIWGSTDALERLPRMIDRFEPRMDAAERERRYAGWQEAVARACLRTAAPQESA